MNKVREIISGAALTTSLIAGGVAIDSNAAEAAQINQGLYDIGNCPDYVGDSVSKSLERSLVQFGFTDITVDGKVTSEREQRAGKGVQIFMRDLGVVPDDIEYCGKFGPVTLSGLNKLLNPGDVNESQISQSQSSSRQNVSNSAPNSREKKYSIDDCNNFDDLSVDTVKAIQRALGVKDDGVFGNVTCNAMINFQESNGIAQYGKGFVGRRTAGALGVTLNKKTQSNNTEFSPAEDCPRPTSCDINIDLTSQRMSIIDAMGVTIWNIPIQSGKLGKESRSGRGKLGPVEYGPGRNPERYSIDYPEAILVNPRSIGNGGQKIHGSYSFNPNATNSPKIGSAGCYRTENEDSFVLAKMPTGTDVFVYGAKPGTQQRHF
jgi:hypothetical protein